MQTKVNRYRVVCGKAALLGIGAVALVGCRMAPTEWAGDRGAADFRGVVVADDLEDLPTERLQILLGNELPWTRRSAAEVLAGRSSESVSMFVDLLEHKDWRVVRAAQDGLLIMLRNSNKEPSQDNGAVRQAVIAGIPMLEKTLKHEHYYVRMGALQCLAELGADAAPAGDAICACTDDEDYLGVVPTAFKTIRAVGPPNFDSDRLFTVMEKSIKSPHVDARKAAIDLIEELEEADQRTLIPSMLYALDHQMNDGYTRFHVQAEIARLLQKLEAEGTLPRIIGILEIKGWGESHRVKQFMPLLVKYGPEADEALPFLEDYISIFKKRKTNSDLIVLIQEAIESIRAGEAKGGQAL